MGNTKTKKEKEKIEIEIEREGIQAAGNMGGRKSIRRAQSRPGGLRLSILAMLSFC
jgi:hypothetical protein